MAQISVDGKFVNIGIEIYRFGREICPMGNFGILSRSSCWTYSW